MAGAARHARTTEPPQAARFFHFKQGKTLTLQAPAPGTRYGGGGAAPKRKKVLGKANGPGMPTPPDRAPRAQRRGHGRGDGGRASPTLITPTKAPTFSRRPSRPLYCQPNTFPTLAGWEEYGANQFLKRFSGIAQHTPPDFSANEYAALRIGWSVAAVNQHARKSANALQAGQQPAQLLIEWA